MRRIVNLRGLTIAAAVLGAVGCGGGKSSTVLDPSATASTALVTVPTTPGEGPQMTNSAIPGLVIADPVTVVDPKDASKSYVTVKMLTLGQVATQTTASVATADVSKLTANLAKGNLVGYIPANLKTGDGVVVPTDSAKAFYKVLAKGTNANSVQFDSMKYGPELQPIDGVPGKMVAAGWIYGKTKNSITVGDGRVVEFDMTGRTYDPPLKRYEETYQLANDVAVYNVNTADYGSSKVSSLADLPVTTDYKYTTKTRQAVYVVFDKNHRNVSSAKVIAIYFFTPQSTSDGLPVWDVPTQSYFLSKEGNPDLIEKIGETDPVSGKKWVDIVASGVSNAPYTRSTEPFEMVKKTMYFVGDNEVAVYLLNADMGTPTDSSDDKLIVLDAGWPNSGYQYWKNIEAVGFDPRKVTDWWGTHGHGDHYGTAVELATMVENGGGAIQFWGSKQDTFGVTSDLQGNVWNITGALPASETEIRARTTKTYDYDKWYDFGNVQIYVTWSPGHTAGTTNMAFKVKNPVDGKWITFGYHGGYGYNGLERPTASNGWKRLDFQHGFSYLQEMFSADYVSPQHTNQYPVVEVYQAVKAYNRDPAHASAPLTFLDGMVSRILDSPNLMTTEFVNQLEKRRSVISYKASDSQGLNYLSLESSGPFKPGRESGLGSVKATILDDGKIIQGFNKFQNKNPKLPLLKDGVAIDKDSYVHDPGGFYVQVYIDVQDSTYQGYLPNNYSQYVPSTHATIVYQGGPVESIHAAKGTYHPPEVLRTQRLPDLATAQAVLATIKKGSTYTIALTPASEIVVPSDPTRTFAP